MVLSLTSFGTQFQCCEIISTMTDVQIRIGNRSEQCTMYLKQILNDKFLAQKVLTLVKNIRKLHPNGVYKKQQLSIEAQFSD